MTLRSRYAVEYVKPKPKPKPRCFSACGVLLRTKHLEVALSLSSFVINTKEAIKRLKRFKLLAYLNYTPRTPLPARTPTTSSPFTRRQGCLGDAFAD